MLVTLDGQRVDAPVNSEATLENLIQQVRAAHADRLIVSVAVNGTMLSDSELTTALARPVADDAQVDLETGDAVELVCNALRGMALEFEQARGHLEAIAGKLDAGETAAGVQDVGGYIRLWQTCHQIVVQCSGLLGADLTQCVHLGRPVTSWFQDAIAKLMEVRQALEARDIVLLADLLRYELPALCDAWQALFSDLAGQIGRTPSA